MAFNNIEIGVKVDSSTAVTSLGKVDTELLAISKSADKASKSTKSFGTEANKAASGSNGLAGTIDKMAASFNKMGGGKVGGSIGDGFKDIASSANASLGAFSGVGNALVDVAAKAGPVGLALAAVGGGFIFAMGKAIESAAAIKDQADAIGMSTDQVQFYDNILKTAGSSMDKFQGALMNLTSKVESNDKSLIDLGITTTDVYGGFREGGDILKDVLYALAAETDATKRSADAKAIFGKQAKAVNILMADGVAGLNKMYSEQEKYISMNANMVNTADAVDRSFEAIGLSFSKWSNSILEFPMLKLAEIMNPKDKGVQIASLKKIIGWEEKRIAEIKRQGGQLKEIAKTEEFLAQNRKALEIATLGVTQEEKTRNEQNEMYSSTMATIAEREKSRADKLSDLKIETLMVTDNYKGMLEQFKKDYDLRIKGEKDLAILAAQRELYTAKVNKVEEEQAKKIKATADAEKARLDNYNKYVKGQSLSPKEAEKMAVENEIATKKTENPDKSVELEEIRRKKLLEVDAKYNKIASDANLTFDNYVKQQTYTIGQQTIANKEALLDIEYDSNKRAVNDRMALMVEAGATEVEIEAEKNRQLLELQKIHNENIAVLYDGVDAKKMASLQANINSALTITNAVTDAIGTVINASMDQRISKEREANSEYQQQENEKLNTATMTDRKRNELRKQLDQKALEDTKKLKEKERKMAITQTIINQQLAVGNAWANGGTWQENLIESGVITTASAAQLAVINMQKFKDSGVVGGIQGASNGPDNTLVMARQGEMYLNRNDQGTLFKAIKSGNLGGSNMNISQNITINGTASQGVVDQIKADNQKFSNLIRETVLDLKYRNKI